VKRLRLGVTLACCWIAPVSAQVYPAKPVRLISPFAAGGGADTIARFFGQKLSASLQQQIVVDNRPGAGSVIGTDAAAKSPPDGYTLLIVNDTHAINASLKKLPYDPVKDFAPITLIAVTPFMLSVHPSLPVKTVQDLVRLAKAKPGQLNYASSGNGSVAHFAGELMKLSAGVKLVHVPYRGITGAVTAVTSGEAHLMFTSPLTAIALVRAGKLRGLAVTGTHRMQIAPEIPTMQEAGVRDYELGSSYGLLAPRGTPDSVIATLNQAMVQALKAEDVRARLRDEAVEPVGSTPEAFQKYLQEQMAKYAKIVRATGMQNE
jgi:tripartite-type tricarboxylate transporter receptor subunit TctC